MKYIIQTSTKSFSLKIKSRQETARSGKYQLKLLLELDRQFLHDIAVKIKSLFERISFVYCVYLSLLLFHISADKFSTFSINE